MSACTDHACTCTRLQRVSVWAALPPRQAPAQQHDNCRPRPVASTFVPPYLLAATMSAAVLSSEAPDISSTSSAPRRKSGRVTRKPAPFVPAASPAGSAKRKRATTNDGDPDVDDVSDDEEQEESSDEPDEEELRDRRRKKKTKPTTRKPATKKPKTNGETVNLAIRPATGKPKKPRKAPIRKSALVEDAEGLYGGCAGWMLTAIANSAQLMYSRVETISKTLPRNGSRASRTTKREPWPTLSILYLERPDAPSRSTRTM